jgi:DNA-directed RNA polymerase subunit K/omega
MTTREVNRLKFYDIDELSRKIGINNKYMLTTLVSGRARAISEQKGRILEEEEKYISVVLDELDAKRLSIASALPGSPVAAEEKSDASVEE